jgi:hypothetical protein
MNENKEYIYVMDKSIEVLSKQVLKLRRQTGRLKLGLIVAAVGGIYITDKLVKVTAIHIKEIKQLQKEIDFLKGDKE